MSLSINRFKLALSLNYLLWPFNIIFSLPLLLVELRKPSKFTPVVVGVVFGLFGWFFKPNTEMDLYRYYEAYEQYVMTGIHYFYKDVATLWIFKAMKVLSLPPNALSAISAFILYGGLSLAISLRRRYEPNINSLFIFSLFFFTTPIILYTGIRFSSSLSLFFIGCVLFFGNNRNYIWFFILSLLFHYLIIVPLIILLISNFLPRLKNKRVILTLMISSLCFGAAVNLILPLLLALVDIINKQFQFDVIGVGYLTGEWGLARAEEMTFAHYFIFNTKKVLLLMIIFSLLKKNEANLDERLYAFLIYLSCFILCFMSFGTIYFRYGQIVILCTIILRSRKLESKNKMSLELLPLYSYAIFLFITDIYAVRNEMLASYINILQLGFIF